MALDLAQERQQAHAYLDRLPVDQLAAVRSLLESMLPPLERKLALAPVDEEPFTEAERNAVAEADEWLKHHQSIPHEQVLAEFGLRTSDWDEMAETPPEESNGNG